MATRNPSQPVLMPGAAEQPSAPADEAAPAEGVAQSAAALAEIAALKAKLAAAEAEAASLRKTEDTSLVFTPVTPHGAQKLAISETAHMSVAEVMAAIADGSLSEPQNNYLCKDGYYTRRS
jgi:hypothetical protein